MTVSNPATFSSIRAEFGGSNNFSQYYRGGPYVPANASATISTTAAGLAMSQFNGVTKPPIMTQSLSASTSSHTFNPKVSTYNWANTNNSATSSPSGGTAPYTYSWTRVSGAATPTIGNPTSQTTSLSYNSSSLGDTCVLQCVCNDSAGHSVTTQITITFN